MELKDICKELIQTREEKGLSLEDISVRTKLPAYVVKKIENIEDLETLGDFYLKGFLKMYAEFLKREDLIPHIKDLFSPAPNQNKQKQAKEPQENPKEEKKDNKTPSSKKKIAPFKEINLKKIQLPNNLKRFIFLIGIIIFISVLIKILPEKKNKPTTPEPITKEQPQKQQEPAPIQAETNKSIASLLTKGKVFVQVTADKKLVFSNILTKGIKESWKAENKLKIKINNPSLISLEINGQLIPTQNQQKPATYIITPQGFEVEK